MSDNRGCETKVLYDTEFEAELAATKFEWRHGDKMEHYRCGSHWHITHNDKSKRGLKRHGYKKCPDCNEWIKNKSYTKHIVNHNVQQRKKGEY